MFTKDLEVEDDFTLTEQSDNFNEEDFEEEVDESSSDFSELDDLLSESVKLHSAKKAKNQGKKLTEEQIAMLEAARIAKEAAIWEVKSQYLVVRDLCCATCRRYSTQIVGKYVYKKNNKGARVIEHVENFLPKISKYTYYLPRITENCLLCEILSADIDPTDNDFQAADLLLNLK